MRRIHTCTNSNFLKNNLKERIGIKTNPFTCLIDLHQKSSIRESSTSSLALQLKQNRQKNIKSKRKNKSSKLFLQTKRTSKQKLTNFNLNTCRPITRNDNYSTKRKLTNLNYTLRRSTIRQASQNKVDMNELEELKNKFLETIERKQNDINLDLITKQNNQKEEGFLNNHNDLKQQMREKRLFIINYIDKINESLNNVSFLMAKYKVHFRVSMFFVYKLFYFARIAKIREMELINQPKSLKYILEQLSIENKKHFQCLVLMLQKLKQSRKWVQMKKIATIQIIEFKQNEKKQIVAILLENIKLNLKKLHQLKQNTPENIKCIHNFCQLLLTIIKDFLKYPKQKQIQPFSNKVVSNESLQHQIQQIYILSRQLDK